MIAATTAAFAGWRALSKLAIKEGRKGNRGKWDESIRPEEMVRHESGSALTHVGIPLPPYHKNLLSRENCLSNMPAPVPSPPNWQRDSLSCRVKVC
jgi:hypothetical protein